jgi:DNA-binding NarL/FixJ family response regulator
MSIRILLADDHRVVLDGLGLLLESRPEITVVGKAAHGREAVQKARELRPDIVIMDIAMPELNGIEAMVKIRERQPSVRVIILSMHKTSEHIHRALKAGASGYLLKEATGTELLDAVHAVSEGHVYMSRMIADFVMDEYSSHLRQGLSENGIERLSFREREILQLVAEGKSSAEIARIVSLSPKTVETYRSRLMKKLGITNLPDLMKFAIRNGVISM